LPEEKTPPWDTELWGARSAVEAWEHALSFLKPLQEIAELFGSDELVGLLKRAEEEGRRELNSALDLLRDLRGESS
jgi:hypothetical protein